MCGCRTMGARAIGSFLARAARGVVDVWHARVRFAVFFPAILACS